MRTVDPKKREAKKQSILKAAIDCFREKGFHQTGMAEICKASKTSPGALYHYFKSKDEIIQEITEQEQREMKGYFEELRLSKNFKKDLFSLIHAVIKDACYKPDNILATEIFAEGTRNNEIAKVIKESEIDLRDGLKTCLTEAVQNKKVTLKLNPEKTARVIMIFIYGTSSMALIDTDSSANKLAELTMETLSYLFVE